MNIPQFTLEYLENGIFITKQCASFLKLMELYHELPIETGPVIKNPLGHVVYPGHSAVYVIDPRLKVIVVEPLKVAA